MKVCGNDEMRFSVFLIHGLAEKWDNTENRETGCEIFKRVFGNVANDDVFKTVDMYFRGVWDKKRTIEELRYYKMNDQICIINQDVLGTILKFKRAYEVKK